MKYKSKKFLLILITVLLVPLLWLQDKAAAYAAAPAFADKVIEIEGIDETYQLEIINEPVKCKYKWTSSNTRVAKVSADGLVVSNRVGSTTIKCRITYPSKKNKTISCKVTVSIPAQEIKINNTNGSNNEHKLLVGEKFDFNTEIVPENSSYSTYWAITGGNKDCIRLDDYKKGIVTGLKEGTVALTVSAVKKETAQAREESIVNDTIFVNVVKPAAAVVSADITGSNEIKVVFDNPIDKSTIIGGNNNLLDCIKLTEYANADNPGTLTASLSSDLKTLTITASNTLNGTYEIKLTGSIKTTGGITINEYDTLLAYNDITPPTIKEVVLDDSGLTATIVFSETMNFNSFNVSNATQISTNSSGTDASPVTLSVLNNSSNYVISADKKSVSINLSRISFLDYGKSFKITITGITDLSGNSPEGGQLTAHLYTYAGKKPQARPVSVIRTSYYIVTVTFSRDIKTPGSAYIEGGSYMSGVVDAADPKKVNYRLTEADALLTGMQTIRIGFWDSYNVISTDTYSQQFYSFSVFFTIDKGSPVLLYYDYDPDTCVLTLTYNEDVSPRFTYGSLPCTLTTITGEVRTGNMITYSKLDSGKGTVIKLLIGNMTIVGSYTITADEYFVVDSYMNKGTSQTLTVNNYGSKASELPAPYSITQSSANLNQIYVEFANMLDPATATDINNYSISGVTIISAQLFNKDKDRGATVLLTVEDGSITSTIDRSITISGIRGNNGLFGEMSSFSKKVVLKENVKPYYVNAVFDSSAKNIIRLYFNEAIKGSMSVLVTYITGNYSSVYQSTVTVVDKCVTITLTNTPVNNSYLRIDIMDNKITDISGNESQPIPSQVGVGVSY